MNEEKLKSVLENHKEWLNGTGGERADLRGAYLSEAYLRWAGLRCADLSEADLSEADLSEADLRGAKKIPFVPMACPDTGAFTAWKRCGKSIVKLLVPDDAERSSSTGRKCRCSKAIVLEIQNEDGTNAGIKTVESDRGGIYTVGETINPDAWDENRWNECTNGIHFFINRQEAVDYR